jgi:hypothetical protein
MEVSSGGNVFNNIHIDDMDGDGLIQNAVDDNVYTGLFVTNCVGKGVWIFGNDTQIAGGRSTGNGTNYTDAGTNTVIAAFTTT